ncbi:MAG: hypothetical protein AB6733_05020 [Clostridiaceae bacterium]
MSVEEKAYLKHWLVNANSDEDNFKDNIEKIFSASKGEVLQMTSNISKGLEKLKEDGIKEGAKEKAYEVAKKAILKGLDDESISELTGLDLGEIKILRDTI